MILLNQIKTPFFKPPEENWEKKPHDKVVLWKHDGLSEVEKLKIRITEDIFTFYHKYPTLHKLNLIYSEKSIYTPHLEGWRPVIGQIAWNTVANLRASDEYKKARLILYAFCNNYMTRMRNKEDIIPSYQGYISAEKIEEELKEHFSYLKGPIGEELHQTLQKERTNYQGIKNYISLDARGYDGCYNYKIEKEIVEFFGPDMLSHVLYLELHEDVSIKESLGVRKKI